MGILLKRLEKGNNYWVSQLPTKDTPFIYPELRTLTDIIFDQSRYLDGRNYECTYVFDDIQIPIYMNSEVKCYMVSIGMYIITETSSKMQMVIKNHVNEKLYDGKKIDENLDIVSIKHYISDIEENHPEMLL